MKRSQPQRDDETAVRAPNSVSSCAHRTRITRINSAGRYFIRCLDCKRESTPHETVTDVFLHWREDLDGAAAASAAR